MSELTNKDLEEMFGSEPKNPLVTVSSNGDIVASTEIQRELQKLREFQITIQEMANEEAEMKEAIAQAFKKSGVDPHTVSLGGVQFVYKKPSVREGIDTKKLKAEKPEIAEQYKKLTNVKESWSIKYDD